jgi:hypothetical protein
MYMKEQRGEKVGDVEVKRRRKMMVGKDRRNFGFLQRN